MPSWLDVKESKTVSKEILKNGPNMKKKTHYIQSFSNIILQKTYSLVKINSQCFLSKIEKGIKNKYLYFKVKINVEYDSFTEVGKGKRTFLWEVGRHTNLRYLTVYLCTLVSTLTSNSKAQGKVCGY